MTLTPVIIPGQTSIGGGITVSDIDRWTLGDEGETLVSARLTLDAAAGVTSANRYALLSRSAAGSWSIVARAGQPAPDAGGLPYGTFDAGVVGPNGAIAYGATYGSSTSTPATFRSAPPSGAQMLIAKDQTAPDTDGWSLVQVDRPPGLMNRAATVISSGAAGPVSGSGGYGIWISEPGQATRAIAHGGMRAPGVEGTFSSGTSFDTRMNDLGEVVVAARATLDGTNEYVDGIWRYSAAGGLSLVAANGMAAPGLPGPFYFVRSPTISNSGRIWFRGTVQHDSWMNSGLFTADRSGMLSLLVKAQTPVPNAPGYVMHEMGTSSTGRLVANERGEVAFYNAVGTPGSQYASGSGVFVAGPDGELTTIAFSGQTAPGTQSLFGSLTNPQLALNDAGDMILLNTKRTNTAVSNGGLWHYDLDTDEMSLILREGQPFEVAPGDSRTIRYIEMMPGHGSSDALGKILAADGHVQLKLWFTDNSQALYMTKVPEPAIGSLATSAAACALLRRRRR